MRDDKRIKESSRIIRQLITDGIIVKPIGSEAKFFMKKSYDSIQVASRLLELIDNEGLPAEIWIINSSYYAMFFAATALLAKFGHKIRTDIGIHKLTYHALVHFFVVDDNKLEKHFIEEYKDSVEQAEELLQLSEEKTEKIIKDLDNEIFKRKIFTYDLSKTAERTKAETSLGRAKNFVKEIEVMIK